MDGIQGLVVASDLFSASVDAVPKMSGTSGGEGVGDLLTPRGFERSTVLDVTSDKLSTLSAEAMERPTEVGHSGSVERLVAEGPRTTSAEDDRAIKISFGEMMDGYVDVTRLTTELGVVASASTSFSTATGKLLSGS